MLEKLIDLDADAAVLVITSFATFEMAVTAWEKGAAGILRKPFEEKQILATVARLVKKLRKAELETENLQLEISSQSLPKQSENITAGYENLTGIDYLIKKVAPLRTTVLITGEKDPGKLLIAETIHQSSARSEGPFIVFDCSGIETNLIEPELFASGKDFENGKNKKGLFESAQDGTIFLDEIGELPVELQSRLLRVINRLEFTCGDIDNEPQVLDVRVIAGSKY